MAKDIDFAQVRHMARLSRLVINEEEEKLFARQFGQILGHMAILGTVDTENVEPMYSPRQENARQRTDAANNLRSRDEILANAPETDGESFMVPRIV